MSGAFDGTRRRSPNRLYRDPQNGRILGVCAGIADYFGFKPVHVRLAAVVFLLMFPVGALFAYFLTALLVARKPADMYATAGEETFWRAVRTDPSQTAGELRHRFREIERRLRTAERFVTSSQFKLNQEFRDLEG